MGTSSVTLRSSLKWAMALLVTLNGPSVSCATRTESGVWWEQADLIAAVEILNVDYSATASDGPMVAEARLLKLVKGSGHGRSALALLHGWVRTIREETGASFSCDGQRLPTRISETPTGAVLRQAS
jgi:hypothetical protein